MEYIALGNFDGVHLGHQELIKTMVKVASEAGATPSVCIFNPHPMKLISPNKAPKLLTSLKYKTEVLKSLGVENIHILTFDEKMHFMNGFDFLKILKEKYDIGLFAVGYNYNFGKGGKWDVSDIRHYCKDNNIISLIFDKYMLDSYEVSSTNIRNLIKDGDLDTASRLLGKPHIIDGKVVGGEKIGRIIDFPTANFIYEDDFCYPPNGVYLTASKIEDIWYYSITNVGAKPTVDSTDINIETHVIDFEGDLYEKNIYIAFLHKLREQVKFNNIDELRLQLIKDKKKAVKLSKKFKLNFL